MSTGPYFHFISDLSVNNHLKKFNDSLWDYTTGQCEASHARTKSLLFFGVLIIYPNSYFSLLQLYENLVFLEFPCFLFEFSYHF